MNDLLIIKKYAQSVAEVMEHDELQICLKDVKILKDIFVEQPKLIEILKTRLVSKQQKTLLIQDVVNELHFSEMWEKLFLLLIHHLRFHQIVNILKELESEIYYKQNTLIVSLKLAHKQDKSTTDKIIAYLEGIYKKDVIAEIEYDPELLGGFYAESETMIVDGSLKNNLKIFVTKKQPKQV
ncbi:MAG: F0F1 ATP synthase subunit delta [Candidatus Stygibacter frigidus]|nr:F0F1 ATP synthase subunit delta [Candidatus Stygibacter frigidus]